jgi:hypothetical protein
VEKLLLTVLAGILIIGSLSSIQPAEAGGTVTHMLESCVNGATFMLQGEIGTAGTLGVDYALGTYVAGGNGGVGHGFGNVYSFHSGHFIGAAESGFVSTPSVGGVTGFLEDADHNWAQGTTLAIVVDLGEGNEADQAIVFNSIDHLGGVGSCVTDAEKLWDAFVEGIEFTVYGTNDLADATAAAATANVFGGAESGQVPGAGAGSTFEQGTLDYVFNDGWMDFGNANEGDDFASVWQFSQQYRYIAVFSGNTDPFLGDGFQSFDNELDAIGRFLIDVGEPCTDCPTEPPKVVGGELLPIETTSLLVAGAQSTTLMIPVVLSVIGIGLVLVRRFGSNLSRKG